MTHAIVVEEPGGPEVLKWKTVDVPSPGPGQLLVRHTAIGLNFIDTYFRTGLYPPPGGFPLIIGNEAAGVVEAVGDGVANFAPGDRVAYASPIGAYAETRVMPADTALKLPDSVSDEQAAAMMLQGMTVRYLVKETYKVTPDSVVLFHAAAGGVGLIAGQWLKSIGATVIGTVSSEEKAELARANGYTHVINYKTEDFVARVKEITDGKGVDVAYDSVGQDTYPGSLDCIKPLGLWVPFGQSSGPIKNFALGDLSSHGSLFTTRPTLFTYVRTRAMLEANAADLFDLVGSGKVKINVGTTFPLKDAAEAHRALEGRRTTGSTVLVPDR
ncbi:quinone oxidoreductase [Acuticoccus sp. M5D2P5]|uniref:quinone oxidoreductase family protein n=1 Tax=Acuticoccus kalidii TaxID=2910977 RepID=UPI001F191D70|nr:quinone oxidoreductase [Acuticoccus kalidii]MCF3932576.1 quinone oxidoreductase [Acuticoccus kalidii]